MEHRTYQSHSWEPLPGDTVENTNPGCKHFGSRGFVLSIQDLDGDAGKTVTYQCTNAGPSWDEGTCLTKTMDQLSPLGAQLGEGTLWHLRNRVGFDTPVYRPGTASYFGLYREARALYRAGAYEPRNDHERDLLESDLGEVAEVAGRRVPLDFPFQPEALLEAEYQGRDVELNEPKRGSGGKAYVYVRDPKTGNVKKVTFGSSMPDAMGDSEADRKRRKSFGDRHGCAAKKDKTKAGYWACRATKFFGRDIPGWW